VEVALFFPWATVFGKATQLADPALASVAADGTLTPAAAGLLAELGVAAPTTPAAEGPYLGPTLPLARDIEARRLAAGDTPEQALGTWSVVQTGRLLARTAVVDMALFYAVLLVGFAYVWNRGDLDWVRAVSGERGGTAARRAA